MPISLPAPRCRSMADSTCIEGKYRRGRRDRAVGAFVARRVRRAAIRDDGAGVQRSGGGRGLLGARGRYSGCVRHSSIRTGPITEPESAPGRRCGRSLVRCRQSAYRRDVPQVVRAATRAIIAEFGDFADAHASDHQVQRRLRHAGLQAISVELLSATSSPAPFSAMDRWAPRSSPARMVSATPHGKRPARSTSGTAAAAARDRLPRYAGEDVPYLASFQPVGLQRPTPA